MYDPEKSEQLMEIDSDNLAAECVRLPTQYIRYAHMASELRADVEEQKAELDVIEAELKRQMRDTPAKFGIEKVTEKGIDGMVLIQPEYKKALRKLHAMRHDADMCNAAVAALEHKKRALTLLVNLEGMSYHADVKPTREGKEAVRDGVGRRKKLREYEHR